MPANPVVPMYRPTCLGAKPPLSDLCNVFWICSLYFPFLKEAEKTRKKLHHWVFHSFISFFFFFKQVPLQKAMKWQGLFSMHMQHTPSLSGSSSIPWNSLFWTTCLAGKWCEWYNLLGSNTDWPARIHVQIISVSRLHISFPHFTINTTFLWEPSS